MASGLLFGSGSALWVPFLCPGMLQGAGKGRGLPSLPLGGGSHRCSPLVALRTMLLLVHCFLMPSEFVTGRFQ